MKQLLHIHFCKKNSSVYFLKKNGCKGDIVVGDIKLQKSLFHRYIMCTTECHPLFCSSDKTGVLWLLASEKVSNMLSHFNTDYNCYEDTELL